MPLSKIPVVLAEPTAQIDMITTIDLDEEAIDIKDIDKEVFVTQCEVQVLTPTFGKLFIQGYIRKNIRYSAVDDVTEDAITGDIRHFTTNVPFSDVIGVTFDINPAEVPVPDNEDEFTFINRQREQFNQATEINFNEPVECELIAANIRELDFFQDTEPVENGPEGEVTFDQIEEKLVLFLTVKLIQLQQVDTNNDGVDNTSV